MSTAGRVRTAEPGGPHGAQSTEGTRPTALVAIGTRPEAIKLAPVVTALAERGQVDPLVVTTGQHGAVVDDVLELFGIAARLELRIARRPDGDLAGLYADLLSAMDRALVDLRPQAMVVQGDTATVLCGAQAAFLRNVPVAHVEAGLRSGSLAAPFPEEGNRRMVAAIASLHLAPTRAAEAQLLAEGHRAADVVVTGNTVVDALRYASRRPAPMDDERLERALAGPSRMVVVTAHRRESWGAGMARIADAVRRLALTFPETVFVCATHMNRAVRASFEVALAGLGNVILAAPLSYGQFARLLARASLVLTDSGGVQEEAPALGVPALVMRDRTERVEGLDAGAAVLVGTDGDRIVAEGEAALRRDRRSAALPDLYGDGQAGRRSAEAIERMVAAAGRSVSRS